MSTFDFEDEYEDDDEHDINMNQVSYKGFKGSKVQGSRSFRSVSL
jgi:hypothetical protein